MKYIRTKDGRILENADVNIENIERVENLWCDLTLADGTIHFVDYSPNEKETFEILKKLKKEIKDVVFAKKETNGNYEDFIYEPIDKENVLNQANIIEKLCDSEVIVWNDSTPSTWNKFLTKQEFEHLYSSFQRKKVIAIYGAVWTDKGLIYVAKMNEKGELELL